MCTNEQIKAVTRQAIRAAGGLEYVANQARVSTAMLSQYGDIEKPGAFVPLDVARDIQNIVGKPYFAELLADYDADFDVNRSCLKTQVLELASHLGYVATAVNDGLCEHGPGGEDLTPRERKEITAALQELVRRANDLVQSVNSREAGKVVSIPVEGRVK